MRATINSRTKSTRTEQKQGDRPSFPLQNEFCWNVLAVKEVGKMILSGNATVHSINYQLKGELNDEDIKLILMQIAGKGRGISERQLKRQKITGVGYDKQRPGRHGRDTAGCPTSSSPSTITSKDMEKCDGHSLEFETVDLPRKTSRGRWNVHKFQKKIRRQFSGELKFVL